MEAPELKPFSHLWKSHCSVGTGFLYFATTAWKSSRSWIIFFARIPFSTLAWKESADMTVCPFSRYLRVTLSRSALPFTSDTRAVNNFQFLFWAEQLSAQKVNSLPSLYFGSFMHFVYALARSSELRPDIASCQRIPMTGWSLLERPSGANVSWKVCLVKIGVLFPGSLEANNLCFFPFEFVQTHNFGTKVVNCLIQFYREQ